jgi:hypothetical protein
MRTTVLRTHPDLYHNRDEICRLDPNQDYERIYQLQALYDFPFDARIGLNLAFYRTFAVPEIAELLLRTGQFTGHTMKRSYDTGLVMYELIAAGFHDFRGREMVRLLNRVHRRWDIPATQYRYVLTAFTVTPTRWLTAHAWRPITANEREGVTRFYCELGRRMNIPDPPETYIEACRVLDHYESTHLAPSAAGATLVAATLPILADQLPVSLRPHASHVLSAMFDDRELARGLGLPPPSRAFASALALAMAARNWRRRRAPGAVESWFQPGQTGSQMYPDGYDLGELGPDVV